MSIFGERNNENIRTIDSSLSLYSSTIFRSWSSGFASGGGVGALDTGGASDGEGSVSTAILKGVLDLLLLDSMVAGIRTATAG